MTKISNSYISVDGVLKPNIELLPQRDTTVLNLTTIPNLICIGHVALGVSVRLIINNSTGEYYIVSYSPSLFKGKFQSTFHKFTLGMALPDGVTAKRFNPAELDDTIELRGVYAVVNEYGNINETLLAQRPGVTKVESDIASRAFMAKRYIHPSLGTCFISVKNKDVHYLIGTKVVYNSLATFRKIVAMAPERHNAIHISGDINKIPDIYGCVNDLVIGSSKWYLDGDDGLHHSVTKIKLSLDSLNPNTRILKFNGDTQAIRIPTSVNIGRHIKKYDSNTVVIGVVPGTTQIVGDHRSVITAITETPAKVLGDWIY